VTAISTYWNLYLRGALWSIKPSKRERGGCSKKIRSSGVKVPPSAVRKKLKNALK
jgi:hypothetical protein